MKKSAVAAAALVGASALTGSVVAPGSATTAAPEMHTKRLIAHTSAFKETGKFTGAGTDVLRSRAGKIVGYDTISVKFYPKRERAVVHVAFALKGGIMLARLRESGPASEDVIRYRGQILKGSGRYNGIDGTINAHSPADNPGKTFVTLRYHL